MLENEYDPVKALRDGNKKFLSNDFNNAIKEYLTNLDDEIKLINLL